MLITHTCQSQRRPHCLRISMLVLLAYNVLLSNTLLFNYNTRYSIGVEAQQQRRKRNGNNGGGQRRRNQQQQNPYGQYGGFGDQFNQQQYANQFNQQQHQQQQNAGDPSEYYKALQLKPNASAKDIKSAYRKLALKYHPDKFKPEPSNSDAKNEKLAKKHNDRFVKVSLAYDVLSDEKKKNAYDKYGQNGLDMLEKGINPEEAGFGQGFGAGGFGGSGMGGGGGFGGGDAFKMFEQMFGGAGMGGGFGGGSGGGRRSRGGGGGGMPNMDGFDNMFGGGGMPNMGGFGGGGQQQRRQQQQQQQQRKKESPVLKDDPSGVAPLGKAKFPDARSKHPWLILFYDKDAFDEDTTTKKYVSLAKQVSEGVLKKAKNVKNNMIFKVGAVDCNGDALRFCKQKLGKGVEIPSFATVLNGSVNVVTDEDVLWNAKKLHDHTIDTLLKIEGLVVNVNGLQHVQQRLLNSSPTPGHPSIAILLLTDKYETSSLYASLAYRHRQDGFAAFGESRGSNLQLAKQFSVKKYPQLVALIGSEENAVALIGSEENVERYDGTSFDSASLDKWLDGLYWKHFKSSSRRKRA